MIHLLAGLQTFDTGGFDVGVTDVKNNAPVVSPADGGGGAYVSIPFLHVGSFDLAAFGGLGAEVEHYAVNGWSVTLASPTAELELGGRFRFGDPALMGVVEFGLGAHLRGAWTGEELERAEPVFGTHTALGAELGAGRVRGLVALRGAVSTESGRRLRHNGQEGDLQVRWSWHSSDLRLLFCGGIAFSGGARR